MDKVSPGSTTEMRVNFSFTSQKNKDKINDENVKQKNNDKKYRGRSKSIFAQLQT